MAWKGNEKERYCAGRRKKGRKEKENAHCVRVSHGIGMANTPSCRACLKAPKSRATAQREQPFWRGNFGKGGRRRGGYGSVQGKNEGPRGQGDSTVVFYRLIYRGNGEFWREWGRRWRWGIVRSP